ncbi:MAG: hypothetical protein GX308_03920 [Epulopiscium sp.]|nr:hypothetical protein [Candidatus Epulonipiscium sp.]
MTVNKDKLTIGIFCGIIYMGLIFNLILPNRRFSTFENRMLQQRPKITRKALISGKLRDEVEDYVADQFVARDFWIDLKSKIEISIGKNENNGIYFGKDGFLLEKFERPSEEILDKNIESILQFSKKSFKDILLLLVPNSVAIYKDKLPNYAAPYPQEKILEYIEGRTKDSLKFVDVYDSLLENKKDYIFYKTDHHWTTEGAYYGYRSFMETEGLTPIPLEDFNKEAVSSNFFGSYYSKARQSRKTGDTIEIFTPENPVKTIVDYKDENKKTHSIYELNHLEEKDKYAMFLDGNHGLLTITTDIDSDKNLLIIKDSFANGMIPFLTSHYKTIHVIDPRYYNLSLEKYIKENHIDTILILYNVSGFTTDTSLSKIKL